MKPASNCLNGCPLAACGRGCGLCSCCRPEISTSNSEFKNHHEYFHSTPSEQSSICTGSSERRVTRKGQYLLLGIEGHSSLWRIWKTPEWGDVSTFLKVKRSPLMGNSYQFQINVLLLLSQSFERVLPPRKPLPQDSSPPLLVQDQAYPAIRCQHDQPRRPASQ
jgi:hypothetical protein